MLVVLNTDKDALKAEKDKAAKARDEAKAIVKQLLKDKLSWSWCTNMLILTLPN